MAHLIELGSNRRHPLSARVVLGRGDGCEVRFEDPMVAPSHAVITRTTNGRFEIRDLGSKRGTFVGSRKVSDAPLANGDELMIGPIRLRFEDDDAGGGDREELVRLRAIVELGRAIGVEHDLERLLGRVLETCFQLLRADRGAIVVYQAGSKTPTLTVTRSRARHEQPFAISTSVLSQVMDARKPYLRTEVDTDHVLQRSQSLSADGVRSVMAVPLRYESGETEWLGVIQLDSRASHNVFSPRDLELLDAIAGPAALAIKNAMLVRRVQTVINDEWQRLSRVVRDLPVGVIVLDDRRACVLANAWIGQRQALVGDVQTGTVVNAICGIPCDDLVGGNVQMQSEQRGVNRTFAISASTTANGAETLILVNDVTDDNERQMQAAHRDRIALIGQLAGGIAHDFNNLLFVILNYANLLGDVLADPDQRDDVLQISRAATSAAELTRQLLTFSRRELVKPTVVDVTSAVHGMEKMLLRTLGPQIQLSTTVESRLPRVLIDKAQLEQILMNLVVNARDAMPRGGTVSIDVRTVEITAERAAKRAIAPGRYVEIEVADRGSGIPPEVLARIFEPYFSTKTRGQGTGLGLATVHGIVQQARGDITVDSIVGQSTTFHVYLPVTEQIDQELMAPKNIAHDDNRTCTVLVVDDDDGVRRLTERILRSAGYRVLSAASGNAALAVASEHTIELLLTDMVMPGMSGRELARALAKLQPKARVVFMSGYHNHTPIAGSEFLSKPFDRTALLSRLRETLFEEDAAPG